MLPKNKLAAERMTLVLDAGMLNCLFRKLGLNLIMADKKYFYGLGRRKAATARARLYAGKGNITINDKPASEYLDGNKSLLAEVTDPLALVGKQKI